MSNSANIKRFKHRALARLITAYPVLSRFFIDTRRSPKSEEIPWAPPSKPLDESKVGVVTTAGVHHRWQKPFDMTDPEGDPTFREIDATRPLSDLMITHDYYDHRDADRDINVVFPVGRLRELEAEGIIGELAERHYGFMGHIDGRHVHTLINETAPEVADRFKADGVDIVLLTPG
jgi:D-proline reductase (dithiol) PrdB